MLISILVKSLKSRIKFYFAILLVITIQLCVSWKTVKIEEISIIPWPAEMTITDSSFNFNSKTSVVLAEDNEELTRIAVYFVNLIHNASGYKPDIITHQEKRKNVIIIKLNQDLTDLGKEGYRLHVNNKHVLLEAPYPAGIFYGVQTLCQLLPPEIYSKNKLGESDLSLPGVYITDKPRFSWRGYMLDASRHFQSVEFVKKCIDLLAMHKMNVFHWHLVDGEGWRIEIKKYPELTEIGAWRKQPGYNKELYGGFYTQKQIKEIVRYANERYVTIVPEIEMPGHSAEVNAVYPDLSCTGEEGEVGYFYGFPTQHQRFPYTGPTALCAGNEQVFEFLENVLDEIIELFPGEYIHIGGDECDKQWWKKCPKCQSRIKNKGLKDEDELQSYFITRIEKYLNLKGRKLIGWDEILEGGLAPNATVMSWRGERGGIAAARSGHDVVMSPNKYLYLDHAQADEPEHPLSWGRDISDMEEVYHYEPVPEILNQDEAKHILGAQVNMWTVYTPTEELVENMTFPRLCAASELTWTPINRKSWDDFSRRMEYHYNRLDEKNVKYYWPVHPPVINNDYIAFTNTATVSLQPPVPESKLVYTIDGEEPTKSSPVFPGSMEFNQDDILKLRTLLPNGKMSYSVSVKLDKQEYQSAENVSPTKQGLKYRYYEGDINMAGNVENYEMKSTGTTSEIKPLLNQKHPSKFGYIFEGYIKIEKKAVHSFVINTNYGVLLYIGDQLVVENDGIHGRMAKIEGKIALESGYHKIRLKMYKGLGRTIETSFGPENETRRDLSGNIFH